MEQTISFVIDKIPPEFAFQFSPQAKDFEISAFDNTDPNPTKTCTINQCIAIDAAGNASKLDFQKQSLPLNIKNLSLKSISYNGSSSSFDPNLLSIAYTLSNNSVADLTQTELIKNQQILNITYSLKKNQSIITDFTKGSKPLITTSIGQKILQTTTLGGKIKAGVR